MSTIINSIIKTSFNNFNRSLSFLDPPPPPHLIFGTINYKNKRGELNEF